MGQMLLTDPEIESPKGQQRSLEHWSCLLRHNEESHQVKSARTVPSRCKMKLSGSTISRSISAFVAIPTKNGFRSEPLPTIGRPALSRSHANVKGSVMVSEPPYACSRIHAVRSWTRSWFAICAVAELCAPNSEMDTCSEAKHVTIFPRHAHFTGHASAQVLELQSSSR
ncbi:hypothetical protein P3T76_013423 [Phytophthora citrophthora]|uniref:Uncharacterized protein n=1 Tax=Phytophthora citrophthora TaxID=4793 RepID=A0AAD9G3B1_9STRA|nr:hypothetical protein P3T76_013423 [Phytophthora citrophthora]